MTRMHRLFLLLAVCGCPKGGNVGSLEQAVPPPHDVNWRETVVIDGIVRLSFGVSQQWIGPKDLGDGRKAWRIVENEEKPEGIKERARYDLVLGPDGFGYLGTVQADGSLQEWEPPELILPPDPVVGAKFTTKSKKGERTVERSCELLASDLCNGGIVSVCEAADEHGTTVMREHFCPGVGWSGYESLRVFDGHSEKRWTEDLVRDGVSVP